VVNKLWGKPEGERQGSGSVQFVGNEGDKMRRRRERGWLARERGEERRREGR